MNPASSGLDGAARPFPTTRWTLISEAADPETPGYRRSLEELAALYWRPVYGYFRRKWNRPPEDALDLTQSFFAALLEKNFLQHLSPEKGRFRSYLRAALDNFMRLDYRSRQRLKHGGGLSRLPLEDADHLAAELTRAPDEAFLYEWAHAVLAEAVEELRAEYAAAGQEDRFRLFAAWDLERPAGAELSYEDLGARFGVPVSTVNNTLYRARKRLRELVLAKVRDTVSSEAEAEAEMLELFERRFEA